jgi:hypothetical protein
MVRKVAQRPDYVLRKFLLPYLHESYEDSLAVLHDAALVVTHTTALATKVAAEKLGVPHVAAVLQPMAMLSVFDPPELAPMPGLMRWINGQGPRWTSVFLRFMKRMSRSWARPIDDLRREVGLPVTISFARACTLQTSSACGRCSCSIVSARNTGSRMHRIACRSAAMRLTRCCFLAPRR